MKTLTKISLLAVASAALALSSANAQMITLETVSDYEGSIQSFNNNQTLTQSFSGVTAIESMTYRFVSTNGTATNATTLEAYFFEWNPTTRRTVGSSLWSPVGAQVIPVATNPLWQSYTDVYGTPYLAFDYTLTPSATGLNPNATYAMVLRAISNTGGGATTFIGLQNISDFPEDSFSYGVGARLVATDLNGGIAYLANNNSGLLSGNSDYGFQQITITPVPEPQTAAAILVVLFVAGLVARRVYLKRQEAAAALVPVAAS